MEYLEVTKSKLEYSQVDDHGKEVFFFVNSVILSLSNKEDQQFEMCAFSCLQN